MQHIRSDSQTRDDAPSTCQGNADDVKEESSVESLMVFLEHGNAEQVRQALKFIRIKCREDLEARGTVLKLDGARLLSSIVRTSTDQETIDQALCTIHNISISTDLLPLLCGANIIAALVYAMEHCEDPGSKSVAATVLYYIIRSSHTHTETIATFDALYGNLIQMLQSSNLRLQKDACYIMCHLSLVDHGIHKMVEEGTVAVLLNVLVNGAQVMDEKVIAVLYNLSKAKVGIEAILNDKEEDGVESIVDVLNSGRQRAKEDAVGTLINIGSYSDEALSQVMDAGPLIEVGSICRSDATSQRGKQKAKLLLSMLKGTPFPKSVSVPISNGSSQMNRSVSSSLN